jgi:hypothetical protein
MSIPYWNTQKEDIREEYLDVFYSLQTYYNGTSTGVSRNSFMSIYEKVHQSLSASASQAQQKVAARNWNKMLVLLHKEYCERAFEKIKQEQSPRAYIRAFSLYCSKLKMSRMSMAYYIQYDSTSKDHLPFEPLVHRIWKQVVHDPYWDLFGNLAKQQVRVLRIGSNKKGACCFGIPKEVWYLHLYPYLGWTEVEQECMQNIDTFLQKRVSI